MAPAALLPPTLFVLYDFYDFADFFDLIYLLLRLESFLNREEILLKSETNSGASWLSILDAFWKCRRLDFWFIESES